MPQTDDKPDDDHGLNPALRQRTEHVYDTTSSPAPIETTSAREGQGEGWPLIWLAALAICVAVTIYLII